MGLELLRKKIDKIDDEIVELLNKRAKTVLDVAKIKRKTKKEAYSPVREREIIERIKGKKSIFSQKTLEQIFREIVSSSRALEKEFTIAYLGPRATFTEMATIKKFGNSAKHMPCSSIPEVFQEVEKEHADFGVVPIESSSEGSVTSTLDMFFDSNLNICGETVVEVDQYLLSKSKMNEITKVYSHPQAIAQCKNWMRKNLPKVTLIETSSTAKAAEMSKSEKGAAAIASKLAANEYGLNIIAEKIQDQSLNRTRFLIIGRMKLEETGKDKTSILFVVQHKPGSLFRALKVFSNYGINMTKIESRPIKGKLWEYAFFVDFQGHINEKRVKSALKELEKNCIELKILGSYPEESE